MKNFWRGVLLRTLIYFTVTVALVSAGIAIAYADNEYGANMSALRTLLVLPFCLCFAIANVTVRGSKPGPAGRWLIHCLLSVGGGFIFLIIPAFTDASGTDRLRAFLILLFCYIIAAVTVIISARRLKKIKEESQKYKNKF